ncbi:MAG: NAD(P)/FAD-dependent oxidoreductase [Anaerolineae bacterium]
MRQLAVDVAIIGGGPAGLAAGIAASRKGASALILERNRELGGVLMQCVHSGFGLKLYGEDLTGPEYAWRWLDSLGALQYLTDTMAIAIEPGFRIIASSGKLGLVSVQARALVLAMGCRERTRGAIAIPGTRPAGVMTAGTAQRLVNIHGYMPGRRFAILGSGDIGMIMARRLTWEGAQVAGVYELMPYLAGLRRNYVQCLMDCSIPLHLSHTVTEIHGERRLSSVSVSPVDDRLRPILRDSFAVEADTLLLSIGLIPENELTKLTGAMITTDTAGPLVDNRMETSINGLFAAGNVVHVHDLADDVSLAGQLAGAEAAHYALGQGDGGDVARLRVLAGENVRSVVPQLLRLDDLETRELELQLRVRRPMEFACLVELIVAGARVGSRRLDYVRPGEMVSVKLSREVVNALAGGADLTVSVVAA